MAFPVGARTTGELVTASIWNADLKDNLNWLFSAVATAGAPVCGFRLSLESGVPVSATDQAGKSTLYVTPASHNRCPVYDGTSWSMLASGQLSLSLAGYTASRPYDIFGYNNAGSFAVESLIWTSATARATALAWQDGILVKSGATSRTYLGSVCINSSGGQTDDTLEARLVYSHYNQVARMLARYDATSSWSMTGSSTWASARGQAANRVLVMNGWLNALHLQAMLSIVTNGSSGAALTGIGEDATSSVMASGARSFVRGTVGATPSGVSIHEINCVPAAGAHTYNWNEWSDAALTAYGSYLSVRSGLTGSVMG